MQTILKVQTHKIELSGTYLNLIKKSVHTKRKANLCVVLLARVTICIYLREKTQPENIRQLFVGRGRREIFQR